MGSKDYRNNAWFEFRENAFNKLGHHCNHCSRNSDEVVLQVHHKVYIEGRKPWEYNLSDCEVLCRGCHAREHEQIRPDYDWNLSHSSDLDALTGTCELCGSSLRFEYHLFHNDWSEMLVVGTVCCDYLTGTKEATEHRKYLQALQRYTKKWCLLDNGEYSYQINKRLTFKIKYIKDRGFIVEVLKLGKSVHLGKKTFFSAEEAQVQLFKFIRNKEYKKYFNEED
ncbi:HNH endonuclease [Acinetobacter wuhouensis]|uniref:HNH endonuclease n=1 Tax=Acinetobacter wuhouensis TaxID=1879050 RepID=A0A3G2T5Q1_9GAMM|nr:hypothetical protein [Acinetobacter wuhouensis]AYO54926.1 hypothetical protein CDG68_15260 [Acinetobacter wuhouensis]